MKTYLITFGGRSTWWRMLAAVAAVAGLAVACPAASSAASSYTCTGSPQAPGTLAGDYWGNVEVIGVCGVNAGQATVHGTLTVAAGGALIAAFGQNDRTGVGGSALTVTGNVRVHTGAAALLGCLPTSFPCLDDPNPSDPTLSSADTIGGNVWGGDALGIIVHNSRISGNVTELGGGGGVTCAPVGIFAAFGQPAYSDYEDMTVGGGLRISGLHSCWLGVARVGVGGSAAFLGVKLADRDGIEILANHISGDLACRDNSMVWDSTETAQTGALFPRAAEPNIVEGTRSGQCVYSSPSTEGGPLGSGPF